MKFCGENEPMQEWVDDNRHSTEDEYTFSAEVKQKGKQYRMISLLILSPDCLNMADSQMSLKYSGEPCKHTVMQNRHLTLFVLCPRLLM